MKTQQKKSWLCHPGFHSFLALMVVTLLTATTAQASRVKVCKGRVYVVPSKREACQAATTSVTVAPGLRVVDVNGETIGYADTYFSSGLRGTVFNPTLNAFMEVDILSASVSTVMWAGGPQYFTTSDCTGQVYTSVINPWLLLNVGDEKFYTAIGRNNPIIISPQSWKHWNTGCVPYDGSADGSAAFIQVQPIAPVEMPSFVPPFSLTVQ